MNYILFNPKSHSEHNDLNIVPGKAKLEQHGLKQISLLDINVRDFCKSLTEKDRLIVCGGDGTLHHFANNTHGIDFPCPVFLARSGTGNDFLNDIGQTDSDSLFDVRKHIKELPCVKIGNESRYFINGVGIGIDGEVCVGVEQYKSRTGKTANYTAIALELLLYKYKRPAAKVVVDGETHHFKDVWMASAMHGRYFGGGMMISPTQNRDSGKLSVMVMHGGSRPKILSIFPSVFKGGHIKHKEIVEIFECDEVTVTFDRPVAFQADGETRTNIRTYSARSARKMREIEGAIKGVEESLGADV